MSDSVRPHRRQPTRLPIPGILQARTLEWVAISFSNAGKWKVKVKSISPTLSDPMDCSLPGYSVHGIFQARVLEWGAIAFSICTHSSAEMDLCQRHNDSYLTKVNGHFIFHFSRPSVGIWHSWPFLFSWNTSRRTPHSSFSLNSPSILSDFLCCLFLLYQTPSVEVTVDYFNTSITA